MRKALYAVLVAGLFLLMLSALVVSPQQPVQAQEKPIDCAHLQAVLLPMPVQDAVNEQARPVDWRASFGVVCAVLLFALPCLRKRDSNGRVLCALRYENSVYTVFRPEVAGG